MVGERRDTRFWLDDWEGVGVGPLCVLFRRIFRVVSNKESAVND